MLGLPQLDPRVPEYQPTQDADTRNSVGNTMPSLSPVDLSIGKKINNRLCFLRELIQRTRKDVFFSLLGFVATTALVL